MNRKNNGSYLWADVPVPQLVERDLRVRVEGRPRDVFGHINPQAAREHHYGGHANDGGGVQRHSCGANYPYVIGQQETGLGDGSVYHYVTGGRLGSTVNIFFCTLKRAQDYVDFMKAGDILREQDATGRREGKHIVIATRLAAMRALGH